MKRKLNLPEPTGGASSQVDSRFATIEASNEKLIRDARGRFTQFPELLTWVSCLRAAVAHLLGKAYFVDADCFHAPGIYGLEFRNKNPAQVDWAKHDHDLIVTLAASLRRLEENAKSDRPKTLSKLGVSSHAFSALRAIAAIQRLQASLVLTTSDGTSSPFPIVNPDVLAAARGDDDAEVPVNGLITGIDSGRDGRLQLRVEQGSWIHTMKGTLLELCAWLSEGKAIFGTARVKDGTLTIGDFQILRAPHQPGLQFERAKQHGQHTMAHQDA